MRDHHPINVRNPMGLFDRGGNANFDVAPANYLPRCQNCAFPTFDGVATREGAELFLATGLAGIKRIRRYKIPNQADRMLVLDDTGKLYDQTIGFAAPILNIAAMTDFSLLTMFGRAYISPHNGLKGLPGEFVYVYEGSGSARKAGFSPPTGFAIVAATGAAGKIEVGKRVFAIIYETTSGHLSKPGPEPFVQYENTVGGIKVNLSNIQAGPAGTAFKHVVVTKAAPTGWNGDVSQLELFFLPDSASKLNNGTTTYIADFYDSELQRSADFVRDELTEIPAALGLFEINGRLGTHTEDIEESMVRISEIGYPEAHNSVNGFIKTRPETGGKVTSINVFRESLYIRKEQRTYMTQDNGSEPSTWSQPIEIDGAKGTPSVNGAAMFLDSKGASSEWFPVADYSGLYHFNGTYGDPETALSAPISGFWSRINKDFFHLVQVRVDPVLGRIYVACPLDGIAFNNCILMGDYNKGAAANTIRWSLWVFPIDPDAIEIDIDYTTKDTIFFIADKDNGNIYRTKAGLLSDWGTAIDSYTITAGLGGSDYGYRNHYNFVRSRIRGVGSLAIKLIGPDAIATEDVPGWTLSTTQGGKMTRGIDFTSEMLYVQFRTNTVGHWFHWNELAVFHLPIWEELPE